MRLLRGCYGKEGNGCPGNTLISSPIIPQNILSRAVGMKNSYFHHVIFLRNADRWESTKKAEMMKLLYFPWNNGSECETKPYLLKTILLAKDSGVLGIARMKEVSWSLRGMQRCIIYLAWIVRNGLRNSSAMVSWHLTASVSLPSSITSQRIHNITRFGLKQ